MNNEIIKKGVAVLLGVAVGVAVGKYLVPAKVITKTQEVIREVEVIKRDVVIVKKEIKRPDGTIEKEERTEDRSQETVKKDTDKRTETIVTHEKPQWRVQGLAGTSLNLKNPIVYGVGVERRILGPISAGAWIKTDQQIGLSVSLEF